jgi:hypothetical protein
MVLEHFGDEVDFNFGHGDGKGWCAGRVEAAQ